jgi:hypothetical protein
MTADREPVLADLPSGTAWEFGGFPYGLEPLTLPHPEVPDAPGDFDSAARYAEACDLVQAIGGGAGEPAVEPCEALDELYWFRWITGHQVSFIVWRMMARLLDAVTEGRVAPAAALGPLCHYVRGYCAMLLYTGSCPRDIYHDVIRPSMRLRHPSFSGGWAPDYRPVRYLLRAGQAPLARTPSREELLRAVRLHHVIHDGVAAKLVPDGRSLLRQSSVQRQDTRLLGLIYDNYFMTLRALVSRHEVVAQLLRRLVPIAQDLATNGLHADRRGEQVEELRTADVVACERSLTDILVQVANCAAGLPGVRAGERLATGTGGSLRPGAC